MSNIFETLPDTIVRRIEGYQTFVLQFLGGRIKRIGELLPSDAHRLNQLIEAERDINKINAELARITQKNTADIYAIFDKVANEDLSFAEVYYKARRLPFIPYEQNSHIRNLTRAMARQTADTYVNLSKTTAYAIRNKKTGKLEYPDIAQQYLAAVDQAVQNISMGFEDFQTNMRTVLKEMADSGIRTAYYPGGVHRRLDSAVRMNILDGMRQLSIEINRQVGEEFDADGVEISAHNAPAPDHADIQGRQFSNDEFDKLNNSLDRPIGTRNCYHTVFPIILGVSAPAYSGDELDEINRKNQEGIEFEGKHYTLYQATQMQRKLETAIRTAKDEHTAARAAGDKVGTDEAQHKITILKNKYVDFSKAAGLSVKTERLYTEGYKATRAKLTKINKNDIIKADFSSPERLKAHLDKHLTQYAGFSEQEYLNRANELFNTTPDTNVLGFTGENGKMYRYDILNNDFAVLNKNKTVATLFKPNDGINYWKRQVDKYDRT